ncbi:large conductance mechanosensitive channel protein MscL [Faecalibacter bovis]|uniref:Large-conductance mechanosensitive channel n=1 Tax=Faecalibacter bovis TaxID=2898187 RepID=A0ABX7XE90_9FLAO|nr:large conductance mechanosensitive channel protein MscL [Faecalibacter bovis]MBS7333646.1 large conductance mechanosensitive channel protein MscL [Weeksellaceae bacterium]QTV06252.1 large conductance mechanosensitive channel protein MscL [Faecalibacter bovis]
MGFFKEFKEFAVKGNVVDLAVGVVIGGAFGKIVTSLVEDIITPAILTPTLETLQLDNLADLVIPGTAIKYGLFLSAFISFVVVAFALFVMIKGINKLKREEVVEEAPAGPTQEELLAEIRDLLKNK